MMMIMMGGGSTNAKEAKTIVILKALFAFD